MLDQEQIDATLYYARETHAIHVEQLGGGQDCMRLRPEHADPNGILFDVLDLDVENISDDLYEAITSLFEDEFVRLEDERLSQ